MTFAIQVLHFVVVRNQPIVQFLLKGNRNRYYNSTTATQAGNISIREIELC